MPDPVASPSERTACLAKKHVPTPPHYICCSTVVNLSHRRHAELHGDEHGSPTSVHGFWPLGNGGHIQLEPLKALHCLIYLLNNSLHGQLQPCVNHLGLGIPITRFCSKSIPFYPLVE